MLGKPSAAYFAAALDALDYEPEQTWMVGDDIEADVAGASALRAAGPSSCGPGSSERRSSTRPRVRPDGVIDSIAALPQWLEAHL